MDCAIQKSFYNFKVTSVHEARDSRLLFQVVQNKIFNTFKMFNSNMKVNTSVCRTNSKISNRGNISTLTLFLCCLCWWSSLSCALLEVFNVAELCLLKSLNPLSANFTKWPNTLKQFVGKLPANCLNAFGHFVNLALKGLRKTTRVPNKAYTTAFIVEVIQCICFICFLYPHLYFDGSASFFASAKNIFLLWSKKLQKKNRLMMEIIIFSC